MFQINTKTKIALALLIVPAITIGAAYYAAQNISTAGRAFRDGIGGVAKKTYYAISRPFRKGVDVAEEMRDRLLTEEEVREFKEGVRKEVEMMKDTVYVSVKGFSPKGASDTLLV